MDKLITFAEAELATGVRVSTWRAWSAARRIPVVRMGRLVKLREADVQKLIDENLVPAAPERQR